MTVKQRQGDSVWGNKQDSPASPKRPRASSGKSSQVERRADTDFLFTGHAWCVQGPESQSRTFSAVVRAVDLIHNRKLWGIIVGN